jgi:aromatic-amino-acid transaminase
LNPKTLTPAGVLIPEAADRPGDDPIFSLHAEAKRRAAGGESVVDATLGALFDDEGRLAVMPSVAEALGRVPPAQAAGYAPIGGAPAYLRAVAQDVLGAGAGADEAVVVATPGGTGAIHHAFWNFLERGQSALAPDYLWGPYRVIAGHAGREVDVFPTFTSGLELDLDAFEGALDAQLERQRRALVILNYPCNNPTGYSLDAEEWARVADIVHRAGRRAPVAVLLDRAYERFAAGGTDGWLERLPRMLEAATVLVAWTASKSFAQYGARVGALVALNRDADVRRRIDNALNYSCRATWSNCNHLGMLAVTDLLTDPELRRRSTEEREALVRLLGERVDAFNDAASAAGLAFPRYEGGFFVSVFTPDGEATAAAMRERGVFVVPIRGAVRVALCATPASVVPRMVDAIAEGVAVAEARAG